MSRPYVLNYWAGGERYWPFTTKEELKAFRKKHKGLTGIVYTNDGYLVDEDKIDE